MNTLFEVPIDLERINFLKEPSVLIAKCPKCDNIISGRALNPGENIQLTYNEKNLYLLSLYEVESKENKQGFFIRGCSCS